VLGPDAVLYYKEVRQVEVTLLTVSAVFSPERGSGHPPPSGRSPNIPSPAGYHDLNVKKPANAINLALGL